MLPLTARPARSLAVALATGAALAAVPAAADAATGVVTTNPGYGLVARAAPSSSAATVRRLANGTRVTIVCQVRGSQVTGRFGTSRLWDKLQGGGYVSDTFVKTGSDGRVAPNCGSATPTPTPAPTPAPTTKKGLANVVGHDDYPYRNASPNGVDPWAFYFRECTSFVAWRMQKNFPDFENHLAGGRFGNARDWDDNARRLGYVVNKTATPGSVYSRESGSAGHVAVVVKATRTQVYVEQYNARGTHVYSKAWVPRAADVEFIHFDQKR